MLTALVMLAALRADEVAVAGARITVADTAAIGALAAVLLALARGKADASSLQSIYSRIDQLERAPVHSSTIVRYRELYRWPLAIGILALFAELGIVAWKAPLP